MEKSCWKHQFEDFHAAVTPVHGENFKVVITTVKLDHRYYDQNIMLFSKASNVHNIL